MTQQPADAEAIAALDAYYSDEDAPPRPRLEAAMRRALDAASAWRRAQPTSGLANETKATIEPSEEAIIAFADYVQPGWRRCYDPELFKRICAGKLRVAYRIDMPPIEAAYARGIEAASSAIKAKILTDNTGDSLDDIYNSAIDDCLMALRALLPKQPATENDTSNLPQPTSPPST